MSTNLHIPFTGFSPKPYPEGSVTQFFGENPQLYGGPTGCCNMAGHNGWDCTAPWGTPILCVQDGKVVEVKESSAGYGKHIRILSVDNEWVYGHLSGINVALGQVVSAGQVIGLMGNTGFVVSGATPYWRYNPYAGTHLHLGRRPCKPYVEGSWDLSYPTGDKAVLTSSYMNGYMGSTDFIDLYKDVVPPQYKFNNNLYFGLTSADVVELQKRLNVTPTYGFFGPLTLAAVYKYQKVNGIPATGFVGPMTRAALNV